MYFYKGEFGFLQYITILKDDGSGAEDLSDKTVQLLFIDQKKVGSDKTVSVTVTDPGVGEVLFSPADGTTLDTVTDYKVRAKITDSAGNTYLRYTLPGSCVVADPNK